MMTQSDISISKKTLASIKRHSIDRHTWIYSRIIDKRNLVFIKNFKLSEVELPIFEVKSELAHTLITTRQILEFKSNEVQSIEFQFIHDVIFGNFKGRQHRPELSHFRVIHLYGDKLDFQIETGKASIGLIYAIRTIRQLRSENEQY